MERVKKQIRELMLKYPTLPLSKGGFVTNRTYFLIYDHLMAPIYQSVRNGVKYEVSNTPQRWRREVEINSPR